MRPVDNMKPIICLDFDGVFNNYKGFDGSNIGAPREGIHEFLEKLSEDYNIIILSVRRYPDIIRWLKEHDLKRYVHDVTCIKPPALVYLDDRCLRFDGDFDEAYKEIQNFKTYWEKND